MPGRGLTRSPRQPLLKQEGWGGDVFFLPSRQEPTIRVLSPPGGADESRDPQPNTHAPRRASTLATSCQRQAVKTHTYDPSTPRDREAIAPTPPKPLSDREEHEGGAGHEAPPICGWTGVKPWKPAPLGLHLFRTQGNPADGGSGAVPNKGTARKEGISREGVAPRCGRSEVKPATR